VLNEIVYEWGFAFENLDFENSKIRPEFPQARKQNVVGIRSGDSVNVELELFERWSQRFKKGYQLASHSWCSDTSEFDRILNKSVGDSSPPFTFGVIKTNI